jgi:hypothetical protein
MADARRAKLVATGILLLVAFGYFVHQADWGQMSQLALTKAVAQGTPSIDHTRGQADEYWEITGDIGVWHGHVYSDKAPGLAFASAPAYLALRAAGAPTHGSPRRIVWLIAFWGAVIPALVLLWLVWREADALVPGAGRATAIVLGLGTLLLGSAGFFLSQTLSALLCFAAFALLLAARSRERADRLVLGGGLLAGYAVTTEYPNVLAVAILCTLVAAGSQRLRRLALYGAGVVLGVLPLLAYDWCAFGSPLRYSRSRALLTTKQDLVQTGIGGVGWPTLHGLERELVDHRLGLLIQSPVLVAAGVGLALLYRRGHRAEALVCGAMTAAYLTYLSGFHDPWGGLASAGPRYLVTILPFLALGLAPLVRNRVVLALALVSIGIQALVDATGSTLMRLEPTVSPLTRLRREDFLPAALNPIAKTHPLPNVFPWVVAVVALVVLLVRDSGLRRRTVD